jgi:hypothetical protein
MSKNENGDDFNGAAIKFPDGAKVGELSHIDTNVNAVRDKIYEMCRVPKEFIGGHGTPLIVSITKMLLYDQILSRANAQIFFDRYSSVMTEEERKSFVEKYAVEIDPDKKPDPKKPGEKTAGKNDPNVNVPKDPDKGTEPFEKKPEGE